MSREKEIRKHVEEIFASILDNYDYGVELDCILKSGDIEESEAELATKIFKEYTLVVERNNKVVVR